MQFWINLQTRSSSKAFCPLVVDLWTVCINYWLPVCADLKTILSDNFGSTVLQMEARGSYILLCLWYQAASHFTAHNTVTTLCHAVCRILPRSSSPKVYFSSQIYLISSLLCSTCNINYKTFLKISIKLSFFITSRTCCYVKEKHCRLENKFFVAILLSNLNGKLDFHLENAKKKENYFVKFLCHIDFFITKII